jgi:hypothetical protein
MPFGEGANVNRRELCVPRGERRQIRPDPDVPIDILGGGYVVAPPSKVAKGDYEFLQGSLDDRDRLPALQNVEVAKPRFAPTTVWLTTVWLLNWAGWSRAMPQFEALWYVPARRSQLRRSRPANRLCEDP